MVLKVNALPISEEYAYVLAYYDYELMRAVHAENASWPEFDELKPEMLAKLIAHTKKALAERVELLKSLQGPPERNSADVLEIEMTAAGLYESLEIEITTAFDNLPQPKRFALGMIADLFKKIAQNAQTVDD